jgi:hypothetical protein
MDGARNMDIPGPPEPVTVVSSGDKMRVVGGDPTKAGLQPGTYIDARVNPAPQVVSPVAKVEARGMQSSLNLPEHVIVSINGQPVTVNRFGRSDIGYWYDATTGMKHNVVISTGTEVNDLVASQSRNQASSLVEPVPAAAPIERGAQTTSPSERFFNEARAIQAWLNKNLTKSKRPGEDIFRYIERVFGIPQDRMAAFASRVDVAVKAQPPEYNSKGDAERAALATQDLLQQSFGGDVFFTARVLGYWSGRMDKSRREWTIPEIAQNTQRSVEDVSAIIMELGVQTGEGKQRAMDRFFSTKQSLI